MVLEIKDQTVNLKNITLEVPANEGNPFIPKVDIKEDDWEWMYQGLDFLSKQKFTMYRNFFGQAEGMILLDPKNADKIRSITYEDPEKRNWVIKENEELVKNPAMANFIDSLFTLKLLYPNDFINIQNDERQLNTMMGIFHWSIRSDLWYEFLYKSSLIFPEKVNEKLVNELYSGSMLNDILQDLTKHQGNGDWLYFTRAALAMKFFYPEQFKSLSIPWDSLREQLALERKRPVTNFYAEYALELALLAANQIIVTPDTIELKQSSTLKSEPPVPLPELKKF